MPEVFIHIIDYGLFSYFQIEKEKEEERKRISKERRERQLERENAEKSRREMDAPNSPSRRRDPRSRSQSKNPDVFRNSRQNDRGSGGMNRRDDRRDRRGRSREDRVARDRVSVYSYCIFYVPTKNFVLVIHSNCLLFRIVRGTGIVVFEGGVVRDVLGPGILENAHLQLPHTNEGIESGRRKKRQRNKGNKTRRLAIELPHTMRD